MAKKVLSVLLAVMMIATLCTVAFVSTSAASVATVSFNGQTGTAKVGDTIKVRMVVDMPKDYAVVSGHFEIAYDGAQLEFVDHKTDLGSVMPALNTKPEQTNLTVMALQYAENNSLQNGNYVEFQLKVLSVDSDIAITENVDNRLINVAKNGDPTLIKVIAGDTNNNPDLVSYKIELDTPSYAAANTAALEAAIADAEAAIAEDGVYTEASVAAVEAAIAEAQDIVAAVAADPYAVSQADVDAAKAAVEAAVAGLREYVSKEALQALVDEAAAIDAADYTEDSYAALAAALADAQDVLDNEDATAEEITAAYDALVAACNGLKAAGAEEDPENPDDTKPGDTKPSETKPEKDTPKTGEGMTVVFALLAVLAAAGVVVVVARKRVTK